MIASIPWLQSALNLYMNVIPFCVNGGMILIRIASEQGVHVCAQFNRLAVESVEDYSIPATVIQVP